MKVNSIQKILTESEDKSYKKLSNLSKFDNKDIIQQEENKSLVSCYYCSYQGKSESEVLKHSVNAHPGIPARPDPSLLELMKSSNNDQLL